LIFPALLAAGATADPSAILVFLPMALLTFFS